MLSFRLKRALGHLSRGARAASEHSLALLITAGVVTCGGQTSPPNDASTDQHSDSPADGNVIVEAPNFDAAPPADAKSDVDDSGVVVEAPNFDAGGG